jgi:hypothetical protein
MLKSFTVTLLLEVAKVKPPTPAEALFPRFTVPPETGGATGVKITVTVAVAAAFSEPILHNTVRLTAAPQVPGLAVAETKVAPDAGRLSVKITLLVNSPLLVIVYAKLTWLPVPTTVGVATGVGMVKFRTGASLVTNASLGPSGAPCEEFLKGKPLDEAVSPVR